MMTGKSNQDVFPPTNHQLRDLTEQERKVIRQGSIYEPGSCARALVQCYLPSREHLFDA